MNEDIEIEEVSRIIRNFLNINYAICRDCRETSD